MRLSGIPSSSVDGVQTRPAAITLCRHARCGFWAALLLAWFWGQAISVSPELGITADEMIHQMAGYEYWRHNDYHFQPENGNLPQRIAALPLLWASPVTPPPDHISVGRADIWTFGYQTYFHLGNQPGLLIFIGRMFIAGIGVATGWLVYLWARGLWGAGGGLIATAFFTTSPSLLAHAGLVTSDMTAAFGFISATLTGWRVLHRVTLGRTLAFGGALAVLALAKFSAPLYVFVFFAMLGVRLGRRAPVVVAVTIYRRWLRGWSRLVALAATTTTACLIAYAAIWCAYGFRYSATPAGGPTAFLLSWDMLLGRTHQSLNMTVATGLIESDPVPIQRNLVRRIVEWTRDHHLLPEAYTYGFINVYTYSKWRPAFFLGDYRTTGWWMFFPVTVLLKAPLIHLGLGLSGLILLVRLPRYDRRAKRIWYRLTPLLLFAGIYWAFALPSNLNIGMRHLLPAECAWCVIGGVLVLLVRRQPLTGGLILAGLFATVNVTTWTTRPSYLAFFNQLGGGTSHGYQYLVDSSLDWGQGLPRLAAWLEQYRGNDRVYLSYFGNDSPLYENIRATRIGDGYFNREPQFVPKPLEPGIYAVSATLLQGVYTMAPGPWTVVHERAYRMALAKSMGENRASLPGEFWFEWDQLRFARLRHYLLTRTPDAQPDPSILIYRLSRETLSEALGYNIDLGR